MRCTMLRKASSSLSILNESEGLDANLLTPQSALKTFLFLHVVIVPFLINSKCIQKF